MISFFVLIPLSLAREFGKLRYFSTFGTVCNIYLAFALGYVYFFDRTIVPSPLQNLHHAAYFNFSLEAVLQAIPVIIFAYMFQMVTPQLYTELEP